MLFAIPFPAIDPVALALGPLVIRWYAIAYIAGIVLGWWAAKRFARVAPTSFDPIRLDDLVVWATLGTVVGGRLGFVLLYQPEYYFQNPMQILMLWRGGLSFHGGLIGVATAIILFARRHGIPTLMLGDVIALVSPIGLFFGRVANFINAEHYGRPTDVPWAMVFPGGGPAPRHPSQLYEAALEGLLLFLLLLLLERSGARHRPGLVFGTLLAGYWAARTVSELYREPDGWIDFGLGPMTLGQFFSVPMLLVGLWLIWRARTRPPVQA